MSLEDLRSRLEAYGRARAAEELELLGAADALRVLPSPRLDAEFSDLFRTETPTPPGGPSGTRWGSFIAAGAGRRAAAEQRRELDELLARVRGAEGGRRGPLRARAAVIAHEARSVEEAAADAVAGTAPAVRGLAARLLQHADLARPPASGLEGAAGERLFPRAGLQDLWRATVDHGRFLRRGDGAVAVRPGPCAASRPLQVPDEIVLLVPVQGGVDSYRRFLAAAGEALAWSHLPRHLEAEDRLLPAASGATLYGALFARRLSDPAWLAARGVTGSTAAAVLSGERSRRARRIAHLAAVVQAGGSDPEDPVRMRLSEWQPADAEPVAAACGARPAAQALEAESLAALLDHHLLSRCGRRWDESRRATDLLRDLWSTGWAQPATELLSSLGLRDTDGEVLLEDVQRG